MTTKGVSLADKLKLSELPLATTPGGRNFTMKALHPSEHTIKSARVPGGNKNSVALNCDMIQTIDILAANSDVTIVASPSMLVPASVIIIDGGVTTRGNFYNAAFGGAYVTNPSIADSIAVLANMQGRITEYRVTSQSVTVELIAPALSDQGTITAYQYSPSPRTLNGTTSENVMDVRIDDYLYPDPVAPSQGLLGTNAYTSKAREGCYLPLRLNRLKWQTLNDSCHLYTVSQAQMAQSGFAIAPTAPLTFPYFESRAGTSHIYDLPPEPKLCGDNVGIVSMRGLAANVAVRVRVRQVVEITSPPGTTYAPLMEVALPPDETAVRMYYEISARMKDAYPASYNDLGKLRDIIVGIGKKVLPYVDPALDMLASSGLPIVSTGAQIAKQVVGAGRNISSIMRQKKKSPGGKPK